MITANFRAEVRTVVLGTLDAVGYMCSGSCVSSVVVVWVWVWVWVCGMKTCTRVREHVLPNGCLADAHVRNAYM